MTTATRIRWHWTALFGSDMKWAGDAGDSGRFEIWQKGGECVTLYRDGKRVGAFATVGAAKRRALEIVKAIDAKAAPTVAPAAPAVETAADTYPARGRLAGHGEIILPEADGSAKTLLDQVRCLLDGRGSLDHCPTTGEVIIRTGLDIQMGGDLVPLDSEGDE